MNILVGASIGGLKSGLKGATKLVGGFASSVKGTLSGLGGVGMRLANAGFIGLGVAGAAAVAGLRSTAKSMDATAKAADRLGISTEAFVGLQHAATLSEVPVEMLNLGLTKMQDNLSTAATKGGPVKKVLNDMGLRSKELINLAPDVAFGKIADGIMSIENPSHRTAAAMDIFGKSGAQLIPLLKEGSAGFAKAREEAERFGLAFTKIDAAKIDAANDAVTKLGLSIKGAFSQAVIKIAPHLTNLVSQADFSFKEIGKSVGNFVGNSITNVAFMARNWDLHWDLMTTSAGIQLNRLNALVSGAFAGVETLLKGLQKNWSAVFADLGNKMKEGLSVGGGWKLGFDSQKAGSDIKGIWQGIKNMGNVKEVIPGQDPNATWTRYKGPIRLFKEGFAKSQADIAAGFPSVIKSNAEVATKLWEGVGKSFNEVMANSTDVALQNKLKELGAQLTKARMDFEKSIVGTKPALAPDFSGVKTHGRGLEVSSQFAAATQLGTTEMASQITASMTAFNKKDDELVNLTKKQNETLEEVKQAITENSVPDFDMISSF